MEGDDEDMLQLEDQHQPNQHLLELQDRQHVNFGTANEKKFVFRHLQS